MLLATDLLKRSWTATEQEEDISTDACLSLPCIPVEEERVHVAFYMGKFHQEVKNEDKVKETGTLPERKRGARVRAVCMCVDMCIRVYVFVCVCTHMHHTHLCVSAYVFCVGTPVWQLEGGVIDQEVEA